MLAFQSTWKGLVTSIYKRYDPHNWDNPWFSEMSLSFLLMLLTHSFVFSSLHLLCSVFLILVDYTLIKYFLHIILKISECLFRSVSIFELLMFWQGMLPTFHALVIVRAKLFMTLPCTSSMSYLLRCFHSFINSHFLHVYLHNLAEVIFWSIKPVNFVT